MKIRSISPPELEASIDALMELAGRLSNAPHWSRSAWLSAFQGGPERVLLVATELEATEWAAKKWAPMGRVGADKVGSSEPLEPLEPLTHGEQWLGFLVASLIPPHAELESIAVSEAFQRRGIGGALIQELDRRLVAAGVTELHLELRASNEAAAALYRQAGFIDVGLRRGYYSDPVEDARQLLYRPGCPARLASVSDSV